MQKKSVEIISKYNEIHNLKHNRHTQFHHLVEEMGELAREIAKEQNDWRGEGFNKEKLAEELIDVLDKLLVLADDYDIDLDKAFMQKNKKLIERFNLDG